VEASVEAAAPEATAAAAVAGAPSRAHPRHCPHAFQSSLSGPDISVSPSISINLGTINATAIVHRTRE